MNGEDEEEVWQPVTSPKGTQKMTFTVNDLEVSKFYRFRIAAANKNGMSDFKELPSATEATDRNAPPEIHPESDFKKSLIIKAGQKFKMFVKAKGRPTPYMRITRGEESVPEGVVVEAV